MFDFITLSLLYFFTAGVSLIWFLIGRWKGGIYWFWMWTVAVALGVLAFEAHTYFQFPLWLGLLPVPVAGFFIDRFVKNTDHKITLTRMISKSGSGEPYALKTVWEGILIVVFFMFGGASFGVHLIPWRYIH